MLTSLEDLNAALRENRPEDYVTEAHQQTGMSPVRFGPGTSEWLWDATRTLVLNPFGYVAGGYLSLFADELMSSAIGSVMGKGEFATTAESKINFIKPVGKGLVKGTSKVLRKGKRVAFLEATIVNEKDEVVATVSSTWTVVGT